MRIDRRVQVLELPFALWMAVYLVVGAARSALAQTPSRIEIGWCAPSARLEAAKAAGFDYVELNASEIAGMSEQTFQQLLERHTRLGMPTPSANTFIPRDGSVPVVGPSADVQEEMAYVKPLFDRLAKLGVKTLVFGGGKAVPDGWTEEATFKQLVDFDHLIAAEGRARGITIVIEPTSEGNFIRTVSEGLRLVNATAEPNVEVMADLYHVSVTKENPSVVLTAGKHLRHVHIANPNGRVFPLSADEYGYAAFFEALKKIGYAGRVSIEGGTKDVAADAPVAIAFLRRALAP